jgi:DNA-binding transcriptional MerR regulator
MEGGATQPDFVPIGTVVETLRSEFSDVSQSSLRFLEREGLITPPRTAGGHRLYATADIQRVRRIKLWQAQGLSLDAIRGRLTRLAAIDAPGALAERFLNDALAGDLPAARRGILEGADLGIALEVLFMDVLRPALWMLGDLWSGGAVSVAQEKEVSEVARELIADLSLRYAALDKTPETHIVAACVAGERHDLGLRMVCGLLRERGIGVHFLGADVAPAFLADAVQRRQPRAVLLSVTGDEQLPAVDATHAILRAAGPPPTILAGGQAVERHLQLVTGWGVLPLTDHTSVVSTILDRGSAA